MLVYREEKQARILVNQLRQIHCSYVFIYLFIYLFIYYYSTE